MVKSQHKIELNAEIRTITGRKVKDIREAGLVPAVLYGKGQEPISLQVPSKDFSRVLKEAGESTLIYLHVGKEIYPTIIHDLSHDNLSDHVIHADFYKVRLDEKIKTTVPITFTGESPAVKNFGGILVKNLHELEVEALPQDLPHEIIVDLSKLENINDHIQAKSLDLGSGVSLETDAESILVTIQEPISQEELEASLAQPSGDISDVEVVTKEKKEEGEESIDAESSSQEKSD